MSNATSKKSAKVEAAAATAALAKSSIDEYDTRMIDTCTYIPFEVLTGEMTWTWRDIHIDPAGRCRQMQAISGPS